MRIAVITANLGNFDKQIDPVEQSIPFDFYRFTDENFPPRDKVMTPRLQSRIVKMFGWQMVPEHDVYIWVDSSCALQHKDSVKWLVDQLGEADMAVFKHPDRSSIQQEADYLKHRLSINCPYITPRYKNELIDEQLTEIFDNNYYTDNRLFASTVFIYRKSYVAKRALKEWWYHTSRYHAIDQLSLPYVLDNIDDLLYTIIDVDYTKTPYITYVRNK